MNRNKVYIMCPSAKVHKMCFAFASRHVNYAGVAQTLPMVRCGSIILATMSHGSSSSAT